MATYEYSGFREDGSTCRGRAEAGNPKQAIRELAANGIFVETINPLLIDAKLDARKRSSLYRELGALLGAGLPLDRAVSMIMETEDPTMSAVLASILEKVREGRTLSDSVGEACGNVGGYERAALASAEGSATLPSMLARMADMLEVQDGVRDKLRSALIYPTFVLFLGVLVAVVMLGFVVPKTETMLKASGMVLPRASVVAVGAAKFVALLLGALIIFAAVAVTLARRRARSDAKFAVSLDKFVLNLPFMGSARGLAGMRFASILSVLTESGMPAVAALPVAGAGTGRPWIEQCVLEQTEKVRNGASLSSAVGALPVFGRELGEWVRVGEAGGCLGAMLDVAAERMQRTWNNSLSRSLALLEPSLLAAVGLFVLVLALALLLPVIGMTRTFT